ncbi:MAG: hypothetical protein AAGF57_14835 [Pseudomonadota bacterium]
MTTVQAKNPVLLLGGDATTLSLARTYGAMGIEVRAVMEAKASAGKSRYLTEHIVIPDGVDPQEYFATVTLSGGSSRVLGSVIIACGDDGVEFVAKNHADLTRQYLLEKNHPRLQLDLLNKEKTLSLAREAGLAIPSFHSVQSLKDIEQVAANLRFPIMLKPHLTFLLYRLRKQKYLLAANDDELYSSARDLLDNNIEFMLCEMIPGPDSQNCSYYTYRLGDGSEYLSLTKRLLRRRPMNQGAGTYQLTENLPDVAQAGKQFFDYIGYRGFGCIEYKRDIRDGSLRVMECNNRFTAVQEQLASAGANAAILAYADITNQPMQPIIGCRSKVAIWSPINDLNAFREVLRRDPKASWSDWWRSLEHRSTVFPFFAWRDPMPFVRALSQQVGRVLKRKLGLTAAQARDLGG